MVSRGKKGARKNRSARELVTAALREAIGGAGLDSAGLDIHLERPNDPSHGDLSCNVALVSAKTLGKKPRDLAEEIVQRISFDEGFVDRVDVAGPGFINFTFSKGYLRDQVIEINRLGGSYGDSDLGGSEKVQVEFVSANPTGPLVIVSARAAAVGAALVNVLRKVGYDAEAEYYVNDAGSQVEKLGNSALIRFRQLEGEEVEFPEEGYPGEYLIEIAREIGKERGRKWLELPRDEAVREFGAFAIERITAMIREDLEAFGVSFDVFFNESQLHGEGVPRLPSPHRRRSSPRSTAAAL